MIINTEPDRQYDAVREILSTTGYIFDDAFETDHVKNVVLKCSHSSDIIITARKSDNQVFQSFNEYPQAQRLPNARIETFIFETSDLEKYVMIQKSRGIQFVTNDIVHFENYSFIQTQPSHYTGNSIGFIHWHQNRGVYAQSHDHIVKVGVEKPAKKYLSNIKQLDHAATRIRAQDRDAAILEFMDLTEYNFEFAIYVKMFNSITNVARLSKEDFALVFTSGVSPYVDDRASGPTERFIHNYGPRVHHLAIHTENIEETFEQLKSDGMGFLITLVGSVDEGLKQTFSRPSMNTFLVTEYIHRYGDFDGFFTKKNVTLLTGATEKQV